MSSIVLSKDCCFAAPFFPGFILTFLCLDKIESFSLASAIEELHEVMDELLESVYGEEILSQRSQL